MKCTKYKRAISHLNKTPMAADVSTTLWLSFIFSLFIVTVARDSAPLFTKDDPLAILNNDTFDSVIYHQENGWFINFYNKWCGHCIRFAPDWKNLARRVTGWQRVFKLAVIDCSEDFNVPVCRRNDVHAFPTLRLLGPNAKFNSSSEEYPGKRSLDKMEDAMINFTLSNPDKFSKQSIAALTHLSSLDDIWDHVAHRTQHIMVVFERDDSTVGAKVILDLYDSPNVVVRRMKKSDADKFVVKTFPALYLIDRDGPFKKIAEGVGRVELVRAIREYMGEKVEEVEEDYAGQGQEQDTNQPLASVGPAGVYMSDLESALQYSLKHEVPLKTRMDKYTVEAVKAYVKVLAKYYPGQAPIRQYLGRLYAAVRDLPYPITGEQWTKLVHTAEQGNSKLPDKAEWTGCAGSTDKYRGYPCGLWTLFHSLTVSAAHYHKDNTEPDMDPKEVLSAMEGYIANFFGCRECAKNFAKMAKDIQYEVKSPRKSVLFLWKAHNKANARLHGDPSEDPQHPKIQFPPSEACSSCRASDGSWDEDEVYTFMMSFYDEAHITQDSELLLEVQRPAVHMQDLESALQYSLRQEVAVNNVINQTKLDALKEYVHVLVKYLPVQRPIRQYLTRLYKQTETLTAPVSGSQWSAIIQSSEVGLAKLPDGKPRWTGCVGSTEKYRGYPCGLWMMFHTLTVSAVLQHQQHEHDSDFDPQEVLQAMRGYIANFFGCRECASNFEKGAKHIAYDVRSPEKSVIFLWKSHNKANLHLAGDDSEDPKHPKVQFPSKDMCPKCHVEVDGEDRFVELNVYKFLLDMYTNIIMDSEMLEVEEEKTQEQNREDVEKRKKDLEKLAIIRKEKQERSRQASLVRSERLVDEEIDERYKKMNFELDETGLQSKFTGKPVSFGFSSIDISMCVLFYLVCAGILLYLYFHFTVKRRISLKAVIGKYNV